MTATDTSMAVPPAAVLWDLDGTLIDSEPYWIDAEFALAEKYGGTWTQEHALNLVGNALLDSGRYMQEHMGIDRTPEEIVDELVRVVEERIWQSVPWRPGARDLLLALASRGVPQAIVTMSYRTQVDPVLDALPEGVITEVVSGDQVENGKPHPEPYLIAAARLGVPIEECIAVEDSPTGLRSATAAGARVLAVPSHVEIPADLGGARLETLAGLNAAGLFAAV